MNNKIIEKLVLNSLKIVFSDWTSRIIAILLSFILIKDLHIDRNYLSIVILVSTFIVVNIIDFFIRTPVSLFAKSHFTKKIDQNHPIYLVDNFDCVLNFEDINYNEYLKSIHLLSLSKNFFRVQLNDHKVIMIPYYFEEMSISERIDMSYLLYYSFKQSVKVREIPESIKKYIFLKIVIIDKI